MSSASSNISVLVLGIGNLVMSDDAIGVMVVQRLQERYRFPDNVEVLDGGTLGLDLLPKLENITNLIMIDAVETGKEAGTCVRLSGQEMGLKDLLAVSELMGHTPREMVLIGVQPDSIEMEIGLTPKIQAQLETLIANVLIELNNWGIIGTPVQPQ
jgi:hydrogenase maturation protease